MTVHVGGTIGELNERLEVMHVPQHGNNSIAKQVKVYH